MDFSFTEEQQHLRDVARRFVENECPPSKAKEWDEAHAFPGELLQHMGDLGWFSLPFADAEDDGASGPIEVAIVAEELAKSSYDVSMLFVVNLIAAMLVRKWATDEQLDGFLDDIIAGRRRLAVSISEPDSGSDAASLKTAARPDGDDLVINGAKMWCTGAGLPDTTMAVYVRTDSQAVKKHQGISLVLIDPSTPGVTLRKVPTLARHLLGTYEVHYDDVRIPKKNVVGPLNSGWQVMLSGLEMERVLLSASYVGTAQSILDEAVAYAREREQFGQPIGTFQSLSHPLADLQTSVDAARLLTYRAAWMLSRGEPVFREGSMAKLLGSETFVNAARWGMQVWGGYGFSTESIMSFRYRESIVSTISGGTSQIQRNIISKSMGLGSNAAARGR